MPRSFQAELINRIDLNAATPMDAPDKADIIIRIEASAEHCFAISPADFLRFADNVTRYAADLRRLFAPARAN